MAHAAVLQADSREDRRDYNEYRSVNVNPEPASRIDLDALFHQDLQWALAGNAVYLSEAECYKGVSEGGLLCRAGFQETLR